MRWRVKSPSGMVHRLTRRRRWGRPVTACGITVDQGWGRTQDPLACLNCIATARGPRRLARAH